MVSPSEATLLVTIRARVERADGSVPVITVRSYALGGDPVDERESSTASIEDTVGLVRQWLTEFVIAG